MSRALILTAAAGAALVGLVGLAHTPAARPLLRLVAGGSCPVGAGIPADPAVVDQARAQSVPKLRGERPAASRPAAGFRLDADDPAAVAAWAAQHGISCQPEGALTTCSPVPAGVLPDGVAHDSISFQFDSAQHLIAVMVRTNALPAEAAAETVAAGAAALTAEVGPPVTARGDASTLNRPLAQLSAEFRFADYRALLTATNVGGGRIAYRAMYQSLNLPG